MNKQLFLASLAVTAVLCACQSPKVRVSGRFIGNDAQGVYLEQVSPLAQTIIDSAILDKDGNYRFEVKGVGATPSLYNVIYNGERIPLLLTGGEKVTLSSVGSLVRNYTIEGSIESELLRKFYQEYVAGAQRLDNIISRYAKPGLTEQEQQNIAKEYTDEYYRIRREQLRFIIENKASLAAVYALYQRLPGDTNLSDGQTDVVYYRTVAEAIEKSYPESPYLPTLLSEIARMNARQNLMSQVSETGYPDLEMTDIFGKKVRLSSLLGKVVLLDFWSAEVGSNNTINADLKQLYKEYANNGQPFEVYQVAIDTSKPLWISAVQEQQLPWISVSDLRGRGSVAIGLYNLQKFPANFLINQEGVIVGKDLYGESLKRELDKLAR